MIEQNIIGYHTSAKSGKVIRAYDPVTGNALEGEFSPASDEEIEQATTLAEEAYPNYQLKTPDERALFLESIAEKIMDLGDELITRAMQETALPEARLIGERGRTVNQLRMFASLIREGSWVEASIDTSIPDREPLPKPDIRKMLMPTGPVVVFTASNFPLAFSTAGGDTASALAAGNPVIVKAHESHLGTHQLVAEAISDAAEQSGMPNGVFSSLIGVGYDLGRKLVQHQRVKGVAFTGSWKGGTALHKLAGERDEPIPVFAEMGSINPVLLLEGKLEEDAKNVARQYAGSINLGVGQFCTNPGLMVGIEGPGLEKFQETLSAAVRETPPGTMLNKGILESYKESKERMISHGGVELLEEVEGDNNKATPAVAVVEAEQFIESEVLRHEVFGPFSLLVTCRDQAEMERVVQSLEGQLTFTLMCTKEDIEQHSPLLNAVRERAGRVIFNGVPTGVEVCPSMHHGGPYPATTDGRFTSVGTDAIKRFARPVCWQDAPDNVLPPELRDSNPRKVWRRVNGVLSRDEIK